jgi:hypothetical protein
VETADTFSVSNDPIIPAVPTHFEYQGVVLFADGLVPLFAAPVSYRDQRSGQPSLRRTSFHKPAILARYAPTVREAQKIKGLWWRWIIFMSLLPW